MYCLQCNVLAILIAWHLHMIMMTMNEENPLQTHHARNHYIRCPAETLAEKMTTPMRTIKRLDPAEPTASQIRTV